ncbi:snurportin-1 [Scaptodrosophila lebanonensis]|uniref:Snurportin-1 n=1 Tax=Drosophila lebanonensis TaxID=7225 RepID=A0A6J2T8W1_DROLE|nr:snurportin-1 [Scaptodrosophila lebanonensis]
MMHHKDLYKKGVDIGVQQQLRQQQLLNEQRQRRLNSQDESRHLEALTTEPEQGEEQQQQQQLPKARKQQNKNQKGQQHFRLQQSEWLRQRPKNLSDWLLVPCPSGKRCLVVAANGRTKVYNKAGRQIMQIRTLLPGDGHVQKCKTVLDCVYVPDLNCFYVLDALTFGQQQLLECEASFRFYWLQARFEEHPELTERSKRNEKAFQLLNYYDFENAPVVEEALQRYPLWLEDKPRLDGLLFYHKDASYTCGTTPLVCWLFAFMLPDVLGMPINAGYEAPEDYDGAAALAYMDEFDRKLLEQRKLMKMRAKAAKTAATEEVYNEMDVADPEGDEDFESLQILLDHDRRLELGELDMECEVAATC